MLHYHVFCTDISSLSIFPRQEGFSLSPGLLWIGADFSCAASMKLVRCSGATYHQSIAIWSYLTSLCSLPLASSLSAPSGGSLAALLQPSSPSARQLQLPEHLLSPGLAGVSTKSTACLKLDTRLHLKLDEFKVLLFVLRLAASWE